MSPGRGRRSSWQSVVGGRAVVLAVRLTPKKTGVTRIGSIGEHWRTVVHDAQDAGVRAVAGAMVRANAAPARAAGRNCSVSRPGRVEALAGARRRGTNEIEIPSGGVPPASRWAGRTRKNRRKGAKETHDRDPSSTAEGDPGRSAHPRSAPRSQRHARAWRLNARRCWSVLVNVQNASSCLRAQQGAARSSRPAWALDHYRRYRRRGRSCWRWSRGSPTHRSGRSRHSGAAALPAQIAAQKVIERARSRQGCGLIPSAQLCRTNRDWAAGAGAATPPAA